MQAALAAYAEVEQFKATEKARITAKREQLAHRRITKAQIGERICSGS